MSTIAQFDREATRIMGLTVEFNSDRKWRVMSNERVMSSHDQYEDATKARLALIDLYLPKLDQITIDGLLRADRIAELRSQIIQQYDAPARYPGHVRSLIVFGVEWNGGLYLGEAYDDEELALIRLKDALDNAVCASIPAREAQAMEAAE